MCEVCGEVVTRRSKREREVGWAGWFGCNAFGMCEFK